MWLLLFLHKILCLFAFNGALFLDQNLEDIQTQEPAKIEVKMDYSLSESVACRASEYYRKRNDELNANIWQMRCDRGIAGQSSL